MQKSALIQTRTSPLKFGDLAEKSELNSVPNFSTKLATAAVGNPILSEHAIHGTRAHVAIHNTVENASLVRDDATVNPTSLDTLSDSASHTAIPFRPSIGTCARALLGYSTLLRLDGVHAVSKVPIFGEPPAAHDKVWLAEATRGSLPAAPALGVASAPR